MSAHRSLVDVYQDACARFADREALGAKADEGWQWLRYRELSAHIDACRAGLAKLGVGPGDRVAIAADNRLEWAIGAYATYGLGAVWVPMYEAQLAREWRFILKDSGARVAFAGRAATYRALCDMRRDVPTLERVIGLDLAAKHADSFESMIAGAPPVARHHPPSEHLAGILYTSGTTGMPKGVELTHGNLVANLESLREAFPLQPGERSVAFLPWTHVFGQVCELHYGLSQGAAIAINDSIANLMENVSEVQPTILVAVPRIFHRIFDTVSNQIAHRPALVRKMFADGLRTAALHRRGRRDTWLRELEASLDDRFVLSRIRERFGGKLKFAICASGALNREIAEFIDGLGIAVYQGYGLCEASPAVSVNTPQHRKLGSVGRPLPGVRVRIDGEGRSDGLGEIVVYGPNVMRGYRGQPDWTARAIDADGGLRTGDLGTVDEEGFLYVVGRVDEEYRLSDGARVLPGPIEGQLKLSPYIANILLYGRDRPYNVAVVVPNMENLVTWAAHQQVEIGDITRSEPAIAMLMHEIEAHAGGLEARQLPQKIVVATEDFTPENGTLTPTLKLKRRVVIERYRDRLEALYWEDET